MAAHGASIRTSFTVGVLALAMTGLLAGCGGTGPPTTDGSAINATSAGTTASTAASTTWPTSTTSAASTDEPTQLRGIPVYWVGQSRKSFALYREFRTVAAVGGQVASAVAAMTRTKPLDPDYLTPWRPASRVTATQMGDAITVDLSTDAFDTQVGGLLAELAVQQLVYTATAAAHNAGLPARTVTITVEGKGYDAWGAVRLGQPMTRAPMADVQAHVWMTRPQEGDTLAAGAVDFKGFGTSFEANFRWEIRTATGAAVAHGFTTGGPGSSDGTFGEFGFTTPLTPGTYEVIVSDDDASGGAEGPGATPDTKRFIVR